MKKNRKPSRKKPNPSLPFTTPPEDAWDDAGLSVRQRLFVAAIVGPAAGNASRAAELAGYKCTTADSLRATAHGILQSPHVQQAIRQGLAFRKATAEWAQAELAAIADGDLGRFIEVDETGFARMDWKKAMAAGAVGLIREIDFDEGGAPKKIRLHDRVKALEIVLKLHGKLIERHDHTSGGKALSLIVDTNLVKNDSQPKKDS
jgi:phage terminase small subunit